MATETILQHWIITTFIAPFLLMFFILFAIFEKTKIFGEDKQRVNALIAFVMGLIFVGAVFPKEVVSNLVLFLTVAIMIVFVALLLWGFATGSTEVKFENKGIKIMIGVMIFIALIGMLLWATGINSNVFNLLFNQSWSNTFWTNFIFLIVVIVALILVLKPSK